MGRRTAAQRIGYAKADEAAARQAATIAFAGDRRDAITAEKRADERRAWNQRSHAVARAGERFGVLVDVAQFADLGRRIATGAVMQPGLMLIGHPSRPRCGRRNSIWLAWIDGAEVPIVFDHDTQAVVTVLPSDAFELKFERRGRFFPELANGGTKAARTYWAEVRS